jgi:hypothetical protein
MIYAHARDGRVLRTPESRRTRTEFWSSPGDIGMSLEETKTLLGALQLEFVAATDCRDRRARPSMQAMGRTAKHQRLGTTKVHTLFGRASMTGMIRITLYLPQPPTKNNKPSNYS